MSFEAAAAPIVLLDFWGVIGRHQPREQVEHMAALIGVPFDAFMDAYWAEREPYDCGCSADAFWAAVSTRLGVPIPAAMVAELVERDTGSWRSLDDDMVALMADLAVTGRRMALLSNAPHELAGFVRDSAAAPYISDFVFSCEIGVAKPQADAFLEALRVLDASAADVVFVDDRLVNVEAARAVGMAGIHHIHVADTRRSLLGSSV